jgi:DNA/RNA endonuclease G (NUC1)
MDRDDVSVLALPGFSLRLFSVAQVLTRTPPQMRFPRSLPLAALVFAGACSDRNLVSPVVPRAPRMDVSAAALPPVRISEFHYDNTGTDAGEAIEVSGPAGTDLTGWQLVLYNGANGAVYDSDPFATTPIPTTCGTRGVVVVNYPVNGIQNGDPDGIALVNAGGTVVEFLSYEGSFTAIGGPANGMVSTDIGVREAGTEPVGRSLSRNGAGVWSGPATNTFGICNDADEPPPAEVASVTVAPADASISVGGNQAFVATAFDAQSNPISGVTFTWSSSAPTVATVNATGVASGLLPGDATITATAPNNVAGSALLHVTPPAGLPDTRVSELHYDNTGTDVLESIEIEGPAGTNLTGWSVLLYNGNGGTVYDTRTLTGAIPATCGTRGVVLVSYPQDGIQNGSPDGFALVNDAGDVVEFFSYEDTPTTRLTATNGPAAGKTATSMGVAEPGTLAIGQSLQRNPAGVWQGPLASSFGGCNADGPIPVGKTITFTGRVATDVPLPVGFQDQLFASVRNPDGTTNTAGVTWSSDTPDVATIDQSGVFTALIAGSATFRATTADGTGTATYVLPTRVPVASATAQYGGNAEFGEPTDNDASDDFIIHRPQYTISYSHIRNTPNWVSYDLDASHIGTEDRCDCFTFDPVLPASFTRYTTADYTGAGAIAGFGIDRGHLARSFDRTTGSLDNAFTFYFSNIIPQASAVNQGPWAVMETFLGDLARFQNKEVYIIAGVAGNRGTVKNEGKIIIPASVWKVAVIMPRDQGLANIQSLNDFEVIAVIMPNDPGVNPDWQTYKTTVDAVEALSGYDLLALLRDDLEIAAESGTKPPVAAVNGPFAGQEGGPSISMSGAGSTDPDGDALTYLWSFGDGATDTGPSVSHTYAQDGNFNVRLIVRDVRGLADTITTTATISNVAPVIASFGGTTLLPGETYSASGSFTDPGSDPWSATVDYGDGSGTTSLALSGKTFSLSHTYATAGSFTVTVRVSDDDVTTTRTATVTVLTPAQAIGNAIALIDALAADGKIDAGTANSLKTKLESARAALDRDNDTAATGKLRALLNELQAMLSSDRLTPDEIEALRQLIERVMGSIS